MRLIDADALKDRIVNLYKYGDIIRLLNFIDNEPTSYNVQKVIEAIDECPCYEPSYGYLDPEAVKDIIRNGGL